MIPIGGAIAVLLAIVVTSYRQTVRAYPHGGGSYIVSGEPRHDPGLVAAAAILTDYVLTVAVSVTAGTVAVVSAAPSLGTPSRDRDRSFFLLIPVLNLRGVKEAGTLFAVPTYGFVSDGCVDAAGRGSRSASVGVPVAATADLRLPRSGAQPVPAAASVLVGGHGAHGGGSDRGRRPAFRRPQSRNAAATLAIMGASA